MAFADDKAAVTTVLNALGADGTDDDTVAPYLKKGELVDLVQKQETMLDNLEARVQALEAP